VSAAVWGIVGVIVGGVITAVSGYSAEWRQRRHRRAAARVTALIEIEEALEAIDLSEEAWAEGWNLVTWNETWQAIREPLAEFLALDSFRQVRLAYGSMFLLQRGLQTIGGQKVTDNDTAFLARIEPRLKSAHHVLE
jgi:hypothetical protein